MEAIKSVFGKYAEAKFLQMTIDKSLDKFAAVWHTKYFGWAPIQPTLSYVSVIGKNRIEAAASVVSRDASAPLRTRATLDKLTGEIPAISQKFKMSENDYRDFLLLQNMGNVSDGDKANQLMDLMWGDVKKASEAPLKRIDIMCLQAVSSGKIQINTTNNPDGLAVDDIDLLMPSGNKVNASVNWNSSPTTAKPLTVDIPGIVQAAAARGITFAKMQMSQAKWYKFIAITEVINYVSNFIGRKQTGQVLMTLDNINQMFSANGWPVVEIVNENIGIEKDGVITTINPWEDTNVAFIPDGQLGVIKNSFAIEDLQPAKQVSYAKANRVTISKWFQNDPFGEFTKGELNAFPAFEAIDSVYLLSTTIAF